MVDHLAYRLGFARNFARCEGVNFKKVRDMAVHLKKLTDGLGPDVADAYHLFSSKLDGCIKPVLVPPSAAIH